jgi:HSP20 family protein
MGYYMIRPTRRYRAHPEREIDLYGGRRMPVDVSVTDEAYEITAMVPGVDPTEIKIEVLEDVVTLRSAVEKDEQNGDRSGRYLLNELPEFAELSRSFRLPEPVDAEKAEANIENGLLKLRIPKAEEALPKTIKVKSK